MKFSVSAMIVWITTLMISLYNVCRNVLCCVSTHHCQGIPTACLVGVPPWLFPCYWFLQLRARCPLFPHLKQVTVIGGVLRALQILATWPNFPQSKHRGKSWRWVLKASSCSERFCNVASICFKQVSSSVLWIGFTDSVVLVLLYTI